MLHTLRAACVLLLLLTVLTGLIYPAIVTLAAQSFFPRQANGSAVLEGDRVVGSELIGQSFEEPRYFWGRPSATAPVPYNSMAGTGSNLAPSNPALILAIQERLSKLRAFAPASAALVPVELVTASASGLDPHLSPRGARFQAPRVAMARGLAEDEVYKLIDAHIETPTLGFLGPSRINVLRLNRALDNRP